MEMEIARRRRREDRISKLGDAALGCILSFLPAKEAARAAALSSPWRLAFAGVHAVSLEEPEPEDPYDYSDSDEYTPSFANVVTASLFARHRRADVPPPPLRALRVVLNYYRAEDASAVDLWVSYAVSHAAPPPAGLELDLRFRREPLCSSPHGLRSKEECGRFDGPETAPRSPAGSVPDAVEEHAEEQPSSKRSRSPCSEDRDHQRQRLVSRSPDREVTVTTGILSSPSRNQPSSSSGSSSSDDTEEEEPPSRNPSSSEDSDEPEEDSNRHVPSSSSSSDDNPDDSDDYSEAEPEEDPNRHVPSSSSSSDDDDEDPNLLVPSSSSDDSSEDPTSGSSSDGTPSGEDDDAGSEESPTPPPCSLGRREQSLQEYTVPAMVFSCAALRSLRIGPCRLSPPAIIRLPSLEELLLVRVSDTEGDVQRLIAACPRLANLTLEACDTVTELSLLHNRRLRSLALRYCHRLASVAFDDTLHSLEYRGAVPDAPPLTFHGGGPRFSSCKVDICGEEVRSAKELTKLIEFLQQLASTKHLHLKSPRIGAGVDHKALARRFPAFTRLLHLELTGCLPYKDDGVAAVSRILQNAPSLEVLSLVFTTGPAVPEDAESCCSSWEDEGMDLDADAHQLSYNVHDVLTAPAATIPSCLRNRLREINLVHYHGGRAQRTLAKFLLCNALHLDKLYCGFARGPMSVQIKLMEEMQGWAMNKPENRCFSSIYHEIPVTAAKFSTDGLA